MRCFYLPRIEAHAVESTLDILLDMYLKIQSDYFHLGTRAAAVLEHDSWEGLKPFAPQTKAACADTIS